MVLTDHPWGEIMSSHVHVQTGAVETAVVAKLNVVLSLWEHVESHQTTAAAATIPKRVQADTHSLP